MRTTPRVALQTFFCKFPRDNPQQDDEDVRVLETIRKFAPSSLAILDLARGQSVSYAELTRRVEHLAQRLAETCTRPLVFLYEDATVDAIVAYLACLTAKIPLCLLEARSDSADETLIRRYEFPDLIHPSDMRIPTGYNSSQLLPDFGMQLASGRSNTQFPVQPHRNLALLLQTSGSTGSPKLVRLSLENLLCNARSIAQYLEIEPDHRSMQTLPMSYAYGLSLVNSHLVTGATIVLSRHSFLKPEFWSDFDRNACRSFAGVPFMYATLEKLRFDPAAHPSLKTMTQAGGALAAEIALRFARSCRSAGARFFVMYGQTEATARIAYVPPERLEEKAGSIGIPIPGGRLELEKTTGAEGLNELIYFGANVMLGYAEDAKALALDDELKGRLATGDLARRDSEGFFFLEGRLKRIVKLYGLRIQLDDIERHVESHFPAQAAAVDWNDRIGLFLESESKISPVEVQTLLSRWLELPGAGFFVRQIDAIPRNRSGKKDYKRLPSA